MLFWKRLEGGVQCHCTALIGGLYPGSAALCGGIAESETKRDEL